MRWLGFDWDDRLLLRVRLLRAALRVRRAARSSTGKAYVDSLTRRRDPRVPRHADRAGHATARTATAPVDENLDLFARMRAGEFPDGAHVLRAKIDMASPNINMRDPVLYRIRRAHHHRTGDAWCIYPMYDFAHPPSDALESITHSLCTLEFEDHRPLYDWLIEQPAGAGAAAADRVRAAEPDLHGDEQAQAARARRGRARRRLGRSAHADASSACAAAATRRRRSATFCERIGVAKRENVVDVALLEHAVREDLNQRAPRVMARAAPARGRHRELSGGRRPRSSRSSTTPRTPSAGTRHGAVLARALHRARRLHGGSAEEVLPARARDAKCGCAAPTSSRARSVVKDAATARSSSCAAPTIPRRAAATRPTAARSRRRCTGSRPRTRVDAEVRLYDRLFTSENPGARPATTATI